MVRTDTDFVTEGGEIEADPTDIHVKIGGVTLRRVMRHKGALPWDVSKDRNLCGETQINDSTQTNWTLTIEAKVSLPKFAELLRSVDGAEDVHITTAVKSGTVHLDTIQYERTDEMDTVHTEDYGEQPLYQVQIQTQREPGEEADSPF